MVRDFSDLTHFCLILYITAKQSNDYGSIWGVGIGIPGPATQTEAQKVWNIFIALGNIAFAYGYSMVLIEIQVLYLTFLVIVLSGNFR